MLKMLDKKDEKSSALITNLSLKQQTDILEFACYVAILLKHGKAYLPDYALFYMDRDYDLRRLYDDEEELL